MSVEEGSVGADHPVPLPAGAADAAPAPLQRLELLKQELSSLRRQFARTLDELAAAPAPMKMEVRRRPRKAALPEADGDRRA